MPKTTDAVSTARDIPTTVEQMTPALSTNTTADEWTNSCLNETKANINANASAIEICVSFPGNGRTRLVANRLQRLASVGPMRLECVAVYRERRTR